MAFCKWIGTIKTKCHLRQSTEYISDEEKTANPEYANNDEDSIENHNYALNAINYITNKEKTRKKNFFEYEEENNSEFLQRAFYIEGEDTTDEQEYFVTGYNCTKDTAYQDILRAHKMSNKPVINFAYHALQSFLEGAEQMTPQLAHQIGKELVEELWGDNFVVLLATHINTGHYHNHIIIGGTSPYTGKKFYKNDNEMRKMRAVSDKLCKKYGLHIITEHSKQHLTTGEIRARQRGEPLMKDLIKEDIDKAVALAYSWNDFCDIMKHFGYRLKFTQKNVTVIPQGKTWGRRLSEKLGYDYSIKRIKERIMNKTPEELTYQRRERRRQLPTIPRIRFKGRLEETVPTNVTNMRMEYYRFAYRLSLVPKLGTKQKRKRVNPYLYDELRKFRKYNEQMKLLVRKNIQTMPQLEEYRDSIEVDIFAREYNRQKLRNSLRRCTDETTIEVIKGKVSTLNSELKVLRKELAVCNDIMENSGKLKHEADKDAELERIRLEENRIETIRKGKWKNEY